MKAKSKALKSYKLDIYRLALFCKKEIVKHNLSKVLMFQCIDNIITFYCMTPVNLYFQLVKVADIVIPKKQKEASKLCDSLNHLWSISLLVIKKY